MSPGYVRVTIAGACESEVTGPWAFGRHERFDTCRFDKTD